MCQLGSSNPKPSFWVKIDRKYRLIVSLCSSISYRNECFDLCRVKAERAAWTNALQGRNSMHTSIQLGDQWAAVIPKNLERDAQAFIQCILEVSRGMKFNVGQPTM